MKGNIINKKNKNRFVRINHNIVSPMVRVCHDGEQLGIMSLRQAIEAADREDLDLVETVPDAKPPVCEIMDFGKWRFDKKKEDKKKQKFFKQKEVRLRPVSSDHDVDIKIEQVRKFLEEKKSVAVNIRFKNREITHKENGKRILEKIIKAVDGVGKVESQPRFEGSTLSVRFSPKSGECHGKN